MPLSPKEYLMQLKHLDDEINTKLEQLEELKQNILSLSSPKLGDKVQTSDKKDFTDTVNKIMVEEERLNKKIDELVNLKGTINSQIEEIDNPLFKVVLINRYLFGLSLLEISNKFGYEYGYTRKIHGWALQEFGKKHKKLLK